MRAMNVAAALQQASTVLKEASPTPRLDAEVLVMHACGISRSELITRNDLALTGEQQNQLEGLLARRQRGEPVAYITGTREFWSMELNVTPATLIPSAVCSNPSMWAP